MSIRSSFAVFVLGVVAVGCAAETTEPAEEKAPTEATVVDLTGAEVLELDGPNVQSGTVVRTHFGQRRVVEDLAQLEIDRPAVDERLVIAREESAALPVSCDTSFRCVDAICYAVCRSR
jgi:hypothetical protein